MFGKLMIERMVRAFVASALAFVAVGLQNTAITSTGLRALGVGAFGAGVSAIMSMLSQLFGDPNSTSFTQASVTGPETGGK